MDTIKIKDKSFSVFIREDQIQQEIARVADEINKDLEGKNPLFIGVLNGSFMFVSDLIKRITISSKVSFVKLASYDGNNSTGILKRLIGLAEDITGRTVVIVEDIIDTGYTMQQLLNDLKKQKPKEIHIATLLMKPGKLEVGLDVKYVAMNIPNDFIVGYGLDYDGYGRNYREIYKIVE